MSSTSYIRLSATIIFLGIALAALGAHAFADLIATHGKKAQWDTAILYHLVHGVALFTIALHGGKPRGFWFLFGGIVLFCGGIYILALTGFTGIALLIPTGGVSFLIGWAFWIFSPKMKNSGSPQ